MSAHGPAAPPAAAAALLDALAAIEEDQLPAGEIVACAPGADGRLVYRRSLGASIAVHDALACLDPRSAWEETRSVRAFLAPEATSRLCLGAARVRRRIRAFLAWHELPGHLWREDGRHGEMPADPALSAAAAAAVMDDPARAADRWSLYARALGRSGGAGGLHPATAAASPAVPPGGDPAADAPLAGFLALAGEEAEGPIGAVEREVARLAADGGPAFPLAAACTVARWWARADLPGRHRLAAVLVPELLSRLRGARVGAGVPDAAIPESATADSATARAVSAHRATLPDDPASAGGAIADNDPADTARMLLALVDLGSTAREIAAAARRLLAELPRTAGWTAAGPTAGAVRCPALTRALVVAAVVRSHALAEEVAPCAALAS